MAKNHNPILGKVGKGLNTITTVLPELQHRTKLDKNPNPFFPNPSTPPPSVSLVFIPYTERGEGVGGLGEGVVLPT